MRCHAAALGWFTGPRLPLSLNCVSGSDRLSDSTLFSLLGTAVQPRRTADHVEETSERLFLGLCNKAELSNLSLDRVRWTVGRLTGRLQMKAANPAVHLTFDAHLPRKHPGQLKINKIGGC